ncbi:MAG: sugar porter family MFS transporter [Bacteroidota bacterium]
MNRLFIAFICAVAALGGLLFGYDTAVISGAIGYMSRYFGMTPTMEGWTSSCVLLGCAVGAGSAGFVSDRIGRKMALMLAALCFFASALGTSLAPTLGVFVAFRILGGLGIGSASIISPMYIAEVSPAHIRGKMVTVNQFAIVTGMLLVYFVNYGIARQGTEEWNQTDGWRWMFGSGAFPSFFLLVALLFIPETPRWVALHARNGIERARKVMIRIGGEEYARDELRGIENSANRSSSPLTELLAKPFRTVFLLGIALAVLQQITGINVFLYYGPEIFKSIVQGTKTDVALLQTIVIGACNMLFTVVAFTSVDRFGRRPLMLIGASGMCLALTAMGVAAFFGRTEGWLLAFILTYIASFALAVGPVTWVILSEIFPTRMRATAMAIATVCLWIANYGVSQTFPMLDKSTLLVDLFHHAFPFWVYAAFCVVLFLLVLTMVPETKGKSLEEIERTWHQRGTPS